MSSSSHCKHHPQQDAAYDKKKHPMNGSHYQAE